MFILTSLGTVVWLVAILVLSAQPAAAAQRVITRELLRDKIRGGWAGQMIGVSWEAPWTPGRMSKALSAPELIGAMRLVLVLDEEGLNATAAQFAKAVPNEEIRGSFAGLMAPGIPAAAARVITRTGAARRELALFTACMYSAAFFERDPARVVLAGRRCLPPKSREARAIAAAMDMARKYPRDARRARRGVEGGAAALALAILYGRGRFDPTLEAAGPAERTDAAGVVGVMIGYKAIPEGWKAGFAAIAGRRFSDTEYTFQTIVESTEYRARGLIKQMGGRVREADLVIR